ncbi:MAG TPA: hypothetical protein VGE09_08410 [Pseudoxanthomonas sp.]
MSKPGHNSGKGGPVDAAKLTAFADRLRALRDGFKDDVQTLMSDAGEANIEGPALRRLVSWMAQDHVKRAEKEAIDEQYRFLAGERATPATPPAGSMLELAIDLYRNEATVRTVAETLQVSVGKAASLRSQAAAFIVHVHENVNTAPKVRQMEAGDLGEWLPAHDPATGEIIDAGPTPPDVASILPSADAWQAVTTAREAHEAAVEAAREARRETRRRENERASRLALVTDADMPDPPAFLRRTPAQGRAG